MKALRRELGGVQSKKKGSQQQRKRCCLWVQQSELLMLAKKVQIPFFPLAYLTYRSTLLLCFVLTSLTARSNC